VTTPSALTASRLRHALRPLIEIPHLGLLLLVGAGLFLLAQRPLNYPIAVGREDGHGSDLPFVAGWNTAEVAGEIHYRWTGEDSHIRVAGLPNEPLMLRLRMLPARLHPQKGSEYTRISVGGQLRAAIPIGDEPRTVSLLLPANAQIGGALDLGVSAPLWKDPGAERRLGTPIGGLEIESVRRGQRSVVSPPVGVPLSIFWPLPIVAVAWLPLRHWLPRRRTALVLAVLLGALLLLAFAADRPRFALGGPPALLAAAWGLLLAIGLRVLLRSAAPRLGVEPSARFLDALALLFFALFTLRYAGRLYPLSMPGDLGFHRNRLQEVIGGHIFLLSRHRGINFPYPPALYLLLAPFRLLPIATDTLVEFSNALLGALGLFPLAYLVLRWRGDERLALWISSVYVLLAPAVMALWWSFLPHIFAQEFALLVLAGIAAGWDRLGTGRTAGLATAGFVLLFAAHFGFYLNMSLVIGALLLYLVLMSIRATLPPGRLAPLRRSTAGLALAFTAAHLLVLVLFYSAYIPLFIEQAQTFRAGGMGAVQGGRVAIPRGELLRELWRAGLVAHYATIGVPLGLLGALRLLPRRYASILPALFVTTVLVALFQAAIPFVTSSTITTRWLSSSAWAVALGGGLLLDALWRRGRAARVLVLGVIAWFLWTTLLMWAHALAYRIRPPEPF